MSKNSLTSIKDESQDLQKQIGCISGFFQLFDRHRFLTGGTSNNSIKELNNNTTKKAKAKNAKVSNARENQQFSTESSGTSMSSSSCSSSMSSLEFNRTIQLEPPSINQMKIPENTNSEQAMKPLSNKTHHFHDIVKDSLHIDPQRLSVKTVAKEEKKGGKILKRIDSPRPLPAAKSVNAGVTVAWDSPRLSYDDRNIQNTLKSATKQRELPRLSLDSRERSIKSFNEGTKSRNLLKMEESETCRRPSSVVAKLMGLEAFPDWTQTCDSYNNNKDENFEESNTSDEYIKQQISESPKMIKRDDASITNVTPYLQASKRSKSSTKVPNGSLSVYGEIEKRMADLEFKKSGKDLRALKQILDAMQRYNESLDNTRDQDSNSPSDNRSNSSISENISVQCPRILQKDPKSPIVIMKPGNVARKANNSASTKGIFVEKIDRKTTKASPAIKYVKDPRNQPFHSVDKGIKMRTSKLMQSSKVPHVINGENGTNSSNIAETRSPRLQKKFDFERRSQPTSTSTDSSSNKRQQNRKSIKLASTSTTTRQQMRYQKRNIKQEVDAVLLDFDGQRSIDSHSDLEVINKGLNENNVEKELSKEIFIAETIVTAEQPSPVSVLDAAFYREDPPSPVKRKSDISKDLDEVLSTYDISEESSNDLPLSSNTKVNLSNEAIDIDLKIHNLVQMLEQFDYSDERFTNFSDHKDPDHKYISEILFASELLTSHNSSQTLHSSGYPINPILFLALEKIKTNNMHFNIQHSLKNNHEEMQRKLIFDVVNEILVQKLILESSCLPYQPEDRKQKGQQLLDVVCTEIDKLQHRNRNVSLANEDENVTSLLWEDLIHHPTVNTECYNEIPNVVLDIERLIFKDLITEVVRGEVVNHSGKYCRKLQLVTK